MFNVNIFRRIAYFVLAISGLLAGGTAVQAGVILQNPGNAGLSIHYYEPIGQSFTAEDAAIRFAFFYDTYSSPNDPLQLELRQGDSLNGTVLDTQVLSLPSGLRGFVDVDFSSATLTVGQQYTAVLGLSGTSHFNTAMFVFVSGGNTYGGGSAHFGGRQPDDPGIGLYQPFDMAFKVTPVPVPAAFWLFSSAFAGFGFISRRNKG